MPAASAEQVVSCGLLWSHVLEEHGPLPCLCELMPRSRPHKPSPSCRALPLPLAAEVTGICTPLSQHKGGCLRHRGFITAPLIEAADWLFPADMPVKEAYWSDGGFPQSNFSGQRLRLNFTWSSTKGGWRARG